MSTELPDDVPDETPCPYPDYEPTARSVADLPNTGADAEGVERWVWDALYEVEDPEMPVSVVDLGLIYGVEVRDGTAYVEMTLTYTGCPARDMLTDQVEQAAASADGVDDAEVVLVWSPGWSIELVTEQGREDLREFGLSVPEPETTA
jgi:metal-sulfur cluster biosynthetic enzyme